MCSFKTFYSQSQYQVSTSLLSVVNQIQILLIVRNESANRSCSTFHLFPKSAKFSKICTKFGKICTIFKNCCMLYCVCCVAIFSRNSDNGFCNWTLHIFVWNNVVVFLDLGLFRTEVCVGASRFVVRSSGSTSIDASHSTTVPTRLHLDAAKRGQPPPPFCPPPPALTVSLPSNLYSSTSISAPFITPPF